MNDDELRRMFEAIRQENAAAHSETRRHFDVVTEGLEKKIQGVAEGVKSLSDKLDRETSSIRQEMREGFATPRRCSSSPTRSSIGASAR